MEDDHFPSAGKEYLIAAGKIIIQMASHDITKENSTVNLEQGSAAIRKFTTNLVDSENLRLMRKIFSASFCPTKFVVVAQQQSAEEDLRNLLLGISPKRTESNSTTSESSSRQESRERDSQQQWTETLVSKATGFQIQSRKSGNNIVWKIAGVFPCSVANFFELFWKDFEDVNKKLARGVESVKVLGQTENTKIVHVTSASTFLVSARDFVNQVKVDQVDRVGDKITNVCIHSSPVNHVQAQPQKNVIRAEANGKKRWAINIV
jgi:hypothetical protein